MRKNLRAMALWSVLLLGTSLVLTGPAFAGCEGMREFTGILQGMKKGAKGDAKALMAHCRATR